MINIHVQCTNVQNQFTNHLHSKMSYTSFCLQLSPASENVKEMKIDVSKEIYTHACVIEPVLCTHLQIVGGTKQLYVVTSSKIHRMPLEQCTRHGNNLT